MNDIKMAPPSIGTLNEIKITPSMLALWHTIVTVATGILLPIILGLVQYVSQHGVNVEQDLSYSIPVLVTGAATLQVSLWHAIKSSPALPQAEQDVEAQAQAVGGHVASQLGTWLEARMTALEDRVLHHQHAAPAPSRVPQAPLASITQAPFTLNATASIPPTVEIGRVGLPQRSWNDSQLMPSINPTTVPPKG